jgi:N-acetylmuramoyl-L-alanine amidase
MKAVILSTLLLAAWAAPVDAAPGRTERLDFLGREYVRLPEWARANNFDVQWLKKDETVQLAGHSLKLVFMADSKEAEINNVKVWLSFPIARRNGSFYISELDLRSTINPLRFPPKDRGSGGIKNIVIDPGHGGKDPGNQDGPRQEKKYTLLLALELRDQLKRAGFNATLTRATDSFIELPDRPDIANRRGADLFISLHWNAVSAGKNEVKGIETYCLTPAGAPSTNARGELGDAGSKRGNRHNERNVFLAYEIQKALVKSLRAEDRGVHRARFAVLRDAEMPALLIEGGYMSNPAESKRIYDPAYRRQMAQAMVNGILAYKQQVEGEKQ